MPRAEAIRIWGARTGQVKAGTILELHDSSPLFSPKLDDTINAFLLSVLTAQVAAMRVALLSLGHAFGTRSPAIGNGKGLSRHCGTG